MRRISLGFILLLSLTGQTNIHAQVTIGSGLSPNEGAILDLKQDDVTLAPGATANKGLGLPRVVLTDLKALTMGAEGNQLVISDSDGEWEKHTGLLVYNVEENSCNSITTSGLYVWKGKEWQKLSADKPLPSSVERLTDARDGEQYLVGRFGDENNVWMLENLRFNPHLTPTTGFIDYKETAANNVAVDDKHFYYSIAKSYQPPFNPADPTNNWETYKQNGILYNWRAATNNENYLGTDQGQGLPTEGPFNSIRGVCPEGWHVPSDREWNELEKYIYENADKYSNYTEAEVAGWGPWDPAWETTASWRPSPRVDGHGIAIKSSCLPVDGTFEVAGKSTPTKVGGFNALLIGRAGNNSVFFYGEYAYFWTSSSKDLNVSYARFFHHEYSEVSRATPNTLGLYPVRCRKDNPGIRTDKDIYHIASGYDKRGTTVEEVVAKIKNDYANNSITVEQTNITSSAGIMQFDPSLFTSLPAQAEHNYKIQAKPMSVPNATRPWQARETYLTIKSTDDKGAETKRMITLNQTNYGLSVGGKFDDYVLTMASINNENIAVQGNTKWKATVKDDNNILNVVPETDTGGTIEMKNVVSTANFSIKMNPDATKYNTATVTFSDVNSLQAAKDITVTIQTCMGAEDRTNLATGVEIYTDPRDGEEYFIGKFGNDTWMLENLRFNPLNTPTTGFDNFTESSASSSVNKYFYHAVSKMYTPPFDPSDPANNWNIFKQNGILYNWQAATNSQNASTSNQGQGQAAEATAIPIQGICPPNWHMPSDREWNELEKHIYENASKYSTYTETEIGGWNPWNPTWETSTSSRPQTSTDSHGTAMKALCPPLNGPADYRITNGNSKSLGQGGFNVLLAGSVTASSVNSYGYSSYFWTSSSSASTTAWSRNFSATNKASVNRYATNRTGLSVVRCKRD